MVMKHSTLRQMLAILFLGTCIACNPVKKQLTTANVNQPIGQVELRLSDLLEDIQVVPLQTNDSVLIGSRAKAAITDQYIIILEPEKVFQFSKEGKYIRTLAVRGNGPGEFNTMVNPVVVPGEEILYYIDFKDIHSIGSINLKSGEIQNPIHFDIKNFSLFTSDSEGYIYGIPNSGMKPMPDSTDLTTTYAFKYNPQKNDLVKYQAKSPFYASMFGNAMIGDGRKVSFINSNYSDTLYSISHAYPQPECILAPESEITGSVSLGSELRFLYPSSAGLIFQRFDSERKNNERRILKSEYMLLDKQQQPQIIKSVIISPFTYIVEMSDMKIYPIPTVSGNHGYLFIDAMDYKIVDPESNVSQNDNPVLIFGKIK